MNKACPNDNYPTPFIDQIINICARSSIFSFMEGFSGYNQISICPEDAHKTTFICLSLGHIFLLKNNGATFQRAMSDAFHYIKHIMEAYLDDLAARSQRTTDRPAHLRAVFY